MLVFVPMAGFGERYRRAGHAQPKPLIPVDGRPMIDRVIGDLSPLRPGDRWLFAINRAHAETTSLRDELLPAAPGAPVVLVDPPPDRPHATHHTVADHVAPDEAVLLNYCDFGARWSLPDFLAWCERGAWDAAMSAYRGFHPHSLGPTLYAYMRTEEDASTAPGARVLEVREKHHFTDDRRGEYASAGLYWFRHGAALLEAARAVVAAGERAAGEFYVSTAVQRLVVAGMRVGAYPLERFFQWGTAEDLADWESWARAMRDVDRFTAAIARTFSTSVQVIPMAGRGDRFARAGFATPKPLIPVAGAPMIAQALGFLPTPSRRVLVVRSEHTRDAAFTACVRALPGETAVVTLDAVTDGQATSAHVGAALVEPESPLLIAPCDAGHLYAPKALVALEHDARCDLAVWSASDYLPARWRPEMYGWLTANGERRVTALAVKELVPGVEAARQEVLTGAFWFRSRALYDEAYAALRASGERVNGELYIDAMARWAVRRGLDVRAFAVERFIPWGTPDELSTFDYWNAVFRGGRALGAEPAP